MKENIDRMLEKLDIILRLARDFNATLKRIELRDENRHINSVPSDDAREPKVVVKAEPELEQELEIVDESEPDLEVVDEPEVEVFY